MIAVRWNRYVAAAFIATLGFLAGSGSAVFGDEIASVAQPPLPGTSPEVMRFIERATSTGQGFSGHLYFAKLPANFSNDIPLPTGASLVGSIRRPNSFGEVIWLFYSIDAADVVHAVDAYESRIVDAGWSEQKSLIGPTRGFVSDGASKTFCAPGRPSIVVSRLTSGGGRNVDITIQRTNVAGQCGNVVDLSAQSRNPVPRFVAPADTEMTVGAPQRSTRTSATFVGKAPLTALIDAFEAQLLSANWKGVEKTVGKRTAIEAFTVADSSGGRWDAVLTLYAAPDKENTYYADIKASLRNPSAAP